MQSDGAYVTYTPSGGADTTSKKLLGSARVLAFGHSKQGETKLLYTADRVIKGLTMVTTDPRSGTHVMINGVRQDRVTTQSYNNLFGYMTYNSVVNPGDEISTYNNGGGGNEYLLLDCMIEFE